MMKFMLFTVYSVTKRSFDVAVAIFVLVLISPLLIVVMAAIWMTDLRMPLYIAPRVGRDGHTFRMVKLRSMSSNADKSGVDSTSSDDARITSIGHLVRRYKLDELTQLWNVLRGDMSLVGPRPNVKRETDLYTSEERRLLSVKPGITDLASIVFSDEGEILRNQADPDIAYNQLIRPGKGHLGIFYLENRNFVLDLKLCFLTVVAVVSRKRALRGVQQLLIRHNAKPDLVEIASRSSPLRPSPPLGSSEIVTSRDGNGRMR